MDKGELEKNEKSSYNEGKENDNALSLQDERLRIIREFTLMSNLFMNVVFEYKPACEHALRIIMDTPDLIVKRVTTQRDITKLITKSVRLDILAEDSKGKLYNIEIQQKDVVDHPRRVRLYSSMVDSNVLKKGKDYEDMPELYMIYISEDDIWKRGKTTYHVRKILDDTDIVYEDGLHIIYVNTAIDDGTAISKLMQYFKTCKLGDDSQGELSSYINYIKEDVKEGSTMCEVSDRLMDLGKSEGEKLGIIKGRAEGKAEGRIEGRAEGEKQGITNSIIQILKIKGEVSGSLSERIHSQSDINILSKWVEYAAMCQSIEEFEDRVSRA